MSRSAELFAEAQTLMPGGVNSPVRAFRAVGGTPLFIDHAQGSKVTDIDGKAYIDYVCSWGAIIHGHADPTINKAISLAASRGTSYGAPHPGEVALAKVILDRLPWLERIRFVNSGTEATVPAIRLARAATGRNKIIKFAGNYHGAADCLLAKAGSGVATFGLPDSAGVPAAGAQDTLVAPYNDLKAVAALLEANKDEVAAILVEPVAGNMGLVPPELGFLNRLKSLADQSGALLVMDEVMTGFRIAFGGATERFGVTPDIACFGKVIGGGLPVGAYAAKKALMDYVAPVGPMYQAGTLSGNPLAMAAGFAAVSRLDSESYGQLEQTGKKLQLGIKEALTAAGVAAQVQRVGSMISLFFVPDPVANYDQAALTDRDFFGRLFHALLERGVYLPPSALESWFFTLAHTDEDIDKTVEAFHGALKAAA